MKKYWLFKSEPDVFSIDDLISRPKQIEPWEGVRNYQARNMLRDDVQLGDLAFFYHSSCPTPGIAGIIKIVKAGYPDLSAQDPKSLYYDPKSAKNHPIWYQVDVQYVKKFRHILTLNDIKKHSILKHMRIAQKGNRLSITPVSKQEWEIICRCAS